MCKEWVVGKIWWGFILGILCLSFYVMGEWEKGDFFNGRFCMVFDYCFCVFDGVVFFVVFLFVCKLV